MNIMQVCALCSIAIAAGCTSAPAPQTDASQTKWPRLALGVASREYPDADTPAYAAPDVDLDNEWPEDPAETVVKPLGRRPHHHHAQVASPFGFAVEDLSPDIAAILGFVGENGVLVVKVGPGSPAAQNGLEPGMLLLSVDLTPVHTVREFLQAIADRDQPGEVLLLVRSQEGSRYVVLKE